MEDNKYEQRVDLTNLNTSVEQLKAEISKVVVGQEKSVDLIITSMLANGHVLVEGVPGVAKTMLTKLVARLIDADFSRIQFTPDLMPSDILGTSVYNMKLGEFQFKQGPVFSQIVLIDEINRSPAKTQAALFEVMEERQVTIDGNRYAMEEPFMVLATQNPIEQEGTYRLPEAQLDRFLFKVTMGYPTPEQEISLLESHHQTENRDMLANVKPVITPGEIVDYRRKVMDIHVEKPLLAYIVQFISETRNNKHIYLGASPRSSVQVLQAAKATAAMQGRDFVTPDDILFVAIPALNHRILLTPEKEMEGGTTSEVLQDLLDRLEIPR